MAAKEKSQKWYLLRLGSISEQHFLNIGETRIGRNLQADIVTASPHNSRNHCVITLDGNDNIRIVDTSSNGVYINSRHLKQGSEELRVNDKIGIGWPVNMLAAQEPQNIYVYQLKNKEVRPFEENEVVDLLSDDEDTGAVATSAAEVPEKKFDVNQNNMPSTSKAFEILVESPAILPNDCDRIGKRMKSESSSKAFEILVESPAILPNDFDHIEKRRKSESPSKEDIFTFKDPELVVVESKCLTNGNVDKVVFSISECDNDNVDDKNIFDDCEIEYSQQIVKEIKHEVNQSFENVESYNDNEDAVLVEDDDEDVEAYQSWKSKLSQDQDEITAKIKRSMKEKAPKVSKLIESLPQSINRRRKSVVEPNAESVPKRQKTDNHGTELPKRRKSTNENERPEERSNKFIKPIHKGSKGGKIMRNPQVRERLAKIAHQENLNKEREPPKRLSSTTPKVKITQPRGEFLTKDTPAAIGSKRRMSKCEADEVRYNKLKEKTMTTSKPSPDLNAPSTSKDVAPPPYPIRPLIHNQEPSTHIDPGDTIPIHPRQSKDTTPKAIEEAFSAADNQNSRKKRRISRCPPKSSPNEVLDTDTDPDDTVPIRSRQSKGTAPKTIEEAFSAADNQILGKKRRISRCPPKSSRNEVLEKIRKTVTFKGDKELVEVRYFERMAKEDETFLVNTTTNRSNETPSPSRDSFAFAARRQSNFQNNPLHQIITDITTWDVKWLLQNQKSPPINGVDHVVTPLKYSYSSFEEYERTILPLLKHELWASILSENNERNKIEIILNDVNVETRAYSKRLVFHCQVSHDSNNQKAFSGDFVVVQTPSSQFFAYITEHRFTRSGYSRTTCFTMEATRTPNNADITINTMPVYMKPVSNIRTELKLFSAVYSLKLSTLKDFILNPLSYVEPIRPRYSPNFKYVGYEPLNTRQKEVLRSIYEKCLDKEASMTLVEGPPGTGKSRLIVSTILQLVFGAEVCRPFKILVCASSNAAVDIIASKVLKCRQKLNDPVKRKFLNLLRFGIVDSMQAQVRCISVQSFLERQSDQLEDESSEIKSLKEQKRNLQTKIDRLAAISLNDIRADDVDKLKKQLKHLNETIQKKSGSTNEKADQYRTRCILERSNVVFSTLSSSINLKQYVNKFDVCIIDEASQSIEPWSLVPLQYDVKALILVGDSQQLPPVVLSQICRENELERSLFTRLQSELSEQNNKSCLYSLNEQYRMHPQICSWPNAYFYKNSLLTAPTTIQANFRLNPYAVLSLDCNQSNNDVVNYHNVDEAKFIINLLKFAVEYADPNKYTYGIITPYAKQREELQNHLKNSEHLSKFPIPVNTIDSYQGQEKDIIILSIVRTVGIGFLANPRRLNVALTRAKKCLLVCGNFSSVKNVRVWKSLLEDASKSKCLHTVPRNYQREDLLRILLKPVIKSLSNPQQYSAS